MFKIFLKIKIKLWKLWIKIKYGKNYFNDLHKLVENTKILEDLERTNDFESIKRKTFYV